MTRRASLHSLTATALLAATPALALPAGTGASPEATVLAELRELAAQLVSARAEKVQRIKTQDYEWATRLRDRELALQERITALLLAQPPQLAAAS